MNGRAKVERKKKATAEVSPAVLASSFEDFDSSKQPAPAVGHSFSNLSTLQPQAKLTVSQPGDPYEKEADEIADQVMRMKNPDSKVDSAIPRILRKEQSDMQLAHDVSPTAQAGLQSSGEPLDAETRAFMEPRFGHDFSEVRVHTGTEASRLSRTVSAEAFTLGHNIVFGEGKNKPGSSEEKRLVAHELTHTLQQCAVASLDPPVHWSHLRQPDGGLIQREPSDPAQKSPSADTSNLDRDYDAAVRTSDWQGAAEKLNGFNRDDIVNRLAKLTPDQTAKIHQGALDNPRVGPDSNIAKMTVPNASGAPKATIVRKGPIPDEEPATLEESIAMAEAKSGMGRQVLPNPKTPELGDKPRLDDNYSPGEWTKWEHTHVTQDGLTISIHWFRNLTTLQDVEFKFALGQSLNPQTPRRGEGFSPVAVADALRKLSEFRNTLKRQIDLYNSEHKAEAALINEPSVTGFAGFWTNRLFNKDIPLLLIWNKAYAFMDRADAELRRKDVPKALGNLLAARRANLIALKQYTAWKHGIEGAGVKMQEAIVVTGALAVVAFVAPAAIAYLAESGAAGPATAEQTFTRIGAEITKADAAIVAAEVAGSEIEIIAEAETEVVKSLMH